MVERFENDERSYLSWAEAHPFGYILSVGKDADKPRYPMVHAVRHALWTSQRETYTRSDYIKVCSRSLVELEHWAEQNYRRPLSHCRCVLPVQPSDEGEMALEVPDMTGVETASQSDLDSMDEPSGSWSTW